MAHICAVCGAVLANRRNLSRHLDAHGIKAHYCCHCYGHFKYESSVKRHLAAHHPHGGDYVTVQRNLEPQVSVSPISSSYATLNDHIHPFQTTDSTPTIRLSIRLFGSDVHSPTRLEQVHRFVQMNIDRYTPTQK